VLQVVAFDVAGADIFTTDVSKGNGGVQGVATDGLLWELTVFWHWKGPSYHQAGWDSYDPTGEVQAVQNEIGQLVSDADCTSSESKFADSFQYRVNDGYDNSNVGTIWFNVGWFHRLPVLVDLVITTDGDTPVWGRFSATYFDQQTVTYQLGVVTPQLGSVVINSINGDYTYTPAINANGTDTFEVLTHDGSGFGDPATVTVIITPVNDVPVAFYAGNISLD